jgi:hypothetical protein
MPDITVTVSFDSNATPQFTFTPYTATLNASGRIILNRAAGSSWTFTGATITNGGTQFTPNVNNGGTNINISDAYTSMGTFCYTVTVSSGGTSYTSPDPEIVNEPPTPKPSPKPPQTPPPGAPREKK